MRRGCFTLFLVIGLVSQMSLPASAAGPFSGGVGQGFTGGIGWGLASVIGKGIVKAGKAIKNRGHKGEVANDERNMGPEDYYNRGVEDGYAKARDDRYSRGAGHGRGGGGGRVASRHNSRLHSKSLGTNLVARKHQQSKSAVATRSTKNKIADSQ